MSDLERIVEKVARDIMAETCCSETCACCELMRKDIHRVLRRGLLLLLQAGQAVLERYLELANSGDAGFWNPEEEEIVKRYRATKAKLLGGADGH